MSVYCGLAAGTLAASHAACGAQRGLRPRLRSARRSILASAPASGASTTTPFRNHLLASGRSPVSGTALLAPGANAVSGTVTHPVTMPDTSQRASAPHCVPGIRAKPGGWHRIAPGSGGDAEMHPAGGGANIRGARGHREVDPLGHVL